MNTTTIEGPKPSDIFERSRENIVDTIEDLKDIQNEVNPFDVKLEQHDAREMELFEAGRNGVTFDAGQVMVILTSHRQELLEAQRCYVVLQRLAKMLQGSLEQTATCCKYLQESTRAIHEMQHMVVRARRMFDAAMAAVYAQQIEDSDDEDDAEEDSGRW